MNERLSSLVRSLIAFAFAAGVWFFHWTVFSSAKSQSGFRIDITVFYSAGSMFRNHVDLYDPAIQRSFQIYYFGREGLSFISPPWVAAFFAPLSSLDFDVAFAVWLSTNMVLLALAAYVIHRIAPLLSDWRLLFMAMLAFGPVNVVLAQGQLSILVLFACSASLYFLRTQRELASGAALGLALFKPHLIIPLVLVIAIHQAFQRKWRFVFGFSSVAALLTLFSLLFAWESSLTYPQFLRAVQSIANAGINPEAMPNLRGLFSLLGLSTMPLAITSLVVLALVFIAWRDSDIDLSFCAALLAGIAIGFHSNQSDLALLALPIAVASKRMIASQLTFVKYGFFALIAVIVFPYSYSLLMMQFPVAYMAAPIVLAIIAIGVANWRGSAVSQ